MEVIFKTHKHVALKCDKWLCDYTPTTTRQKQYKIHRARKKKTVDKKKDLKTHWAGGEETPNLLLKMVVTRDGEEDGDLTSMVFWILIPILSDCLNFFCLGFDQFKVLSFWSPFSRCSSKTVLFRFWSCCSSLSSLSSTCSPMEFASSQDWLKWEDCDVSSDAYF